MSDVAEYRANEAVLRAREMFRRALSAWAMDTLALRRAGLDKPCVRTRGRALTARAA
ncbi:MAG: hypothetical protein AB7G17_10430 [Phycisphaerales bacterium]